MIRPPDDGNPESSVFWAEARTAIRWATDEVNGSLTGVERHALAFLWAQALDEPVNITIYAEQVGVSRFKLSRAIPKLPKRIAEVLGLDEFVVHPDEDVFVELLVAAYRRSLADLPKSG